MQKFLVFWLPLGIIGIIILSFLWLMMIKTGNKSRDYDIDKMNKDGYQTDYSRLISIYEFLSRFPLTSKSTNQLQDIISGLSIYNNVEQRVETARIAGMSYIVCIIIATVSVVITSGDMLLSGTALILAVAMRRDFVNKRLQKKRLRFWQDLLLTITSLTQEYERSSSLTKAISLCQAEETTQYLVANVENILKSDDPESALTHFCNNNPFHICIRFAYLCFNTNTYNAQYIEKEGIDSFVSQMDSLLADLQVEIDLALKEKKKFYTAEKLPLVGLLFAFVGPNFLTGYFPGLKYFYNDGLGFLFRVGSVAAIIVSYIVATRLNDKDKSQEDVTVWELKKFNEIDFNESWMDRAGDRRIATFKIAIDKSLSYLTPAMVMLRKCIYSISCFILAVALMATYILIERNSLRSNYKTISDTVMEQLETNYEDYNFVIKKVYDDKENFETQEQVSDYLYKQGWNMTDADIDTLSNQVIVNKLKISTTSFGPIHLMIAFLIMLCGYMIPEIMLARRARLVRQEAKIEILLLQSVVCQLMYTPLKLRSYLIFFSSISKLYASTHLLSYVHQFNNPEFIKAQAYLMFDSDYYLLMEQLYSLHSTQTPKQIFRTTEAKRRYLATKSLEAREESLTNNYSILSVLTKAGLMIPAVLLVILPIVLFVSETLAQYMSMLPE